MRDKLIQDAESEAADLGGGDGPTLAPGGWAATLSMTVADDLEAVFAHVAPHQGRDMVWIAQAEAVQSLRPRPRRRPRWISTVVGALLVIAGLGGGLAGGFYLSAHSARTVRQPLYALQISGAPNASAPHARPAPRLLAQPLPTAPSPIAATRQAVLQPVSPSPGKSPDPASLRPTDTDHEIKSLAADCDRGVTCDAAAVSRADRMVSDAYASALRLGAPAADLADLRRRWNDLRHEADEPPQILVGNYALLAKELNRMTSTPRRSRQATTGAAR